MPASRRRSTSYKLALCLFAVLFLILIFLIFYLYFIDIIDCHSFEVEDGDLRLDRTQ